MSGHDSPCAFDQAGVSTPQSGKLWQRPGWSIGRVDHNDLVSVCLGHHRLIYFADCTGNGNIPRKFHDEPGIPVDSRILDRRLEDDLLVLAG